MPHDHSSFILYTYTRELLPSGAWNVNHPERVDASGNSLPLTAEIEAALPGHLACVHGHGPELLVYTVSALTDAEKATLDSVIQNHKQNV